MTDEEMINRLSLSVITSNIEAEKYPNCIVKKSDLCDLLNLYKKKSKMIELMAEHLTIPVHDKNWVIKYFEEEVELDEEV